MDIVNDWYHFYNDVSPQYINQSLHMSIEICMQKKKGDKYNWGDMLNYLLLHLSIVENIMDIDFHVQKHILID